MKKRLIDILFILLFLVLCLIPSLGILIFGESEAAANEILTTRPSAQNRDGSFNWELLSDFSDYIADRFAFRQEMVTAWSSVNAELFSTSVEEQVILGRDGWLYYRETLDDYLGKGMSDEELEYAAKNLALMQEYAESQGTAFVFTIAPNKNSLYPEHMPTYYSSGHNGSNAERLPALLEQNGVNYVDLFEAFRNEEVLYFSIDSHWNAQGAALAADQILSGLGMESNYFSGSFTNPVNHRGDLYEMLYPAGTMTEPDLQLSSGFSYTCENDPNGGNAITINTTAEGREGTLLCWRDSFGISLYPYLAEKFGSATFSRASSYDLSQIETLGADTVIIELVERNLEHLITSAPVFAAPERQLSIGAKGEGSFTVSVTAPKDEGGLTHITGEIPLSAMDAGSGIYLAVGEQIFEACVLRGSDHDHLSFSAWIAAGNEEPLSLVVCSNNVFTLYDTEMN
ncbi:MAG: hypothetical protein ACI3VA_11425 [Candidatus Limivicinus sp.]